MKFENLTQAITQAQETNLKYERSPEDSVRFIKINVADLIRDVYLKSNLTSEEMLEEILGLLK